MPDIPASVDNKYKHVFESLDKFRDELSQQWVEAVTEGRDEVQRLADAKAKDRIYGQRGEVNKLIELKVTKENYKTVKNTFMLIQEYEKLKINPDDDGRIFKKGAELGFSEDESLAVYNLVHYKKAFDNIQVQRQEIVKYLISGV